MSLLLVGQVKVTVLCGRYLLLQQSEIHGKVFQCQMYWVVEELVVVRMHYSSTLFFAVDCKPSTPSFSFYLVFGKGRLEFGTVMLLPKVLLVWQTSLPFSFLKSGASLMVDCKVHLEVYNLT